jgi:biotin carboxylase
MNNLRDKKLLILGGPRLACEVVQRAQELGVYVVVTDYLEGSPAKCMADKDSMVSTTDIDAVVRLIQDEKIDGVLPGFIESMLPYYQQICERAGLPCYATKEQIEITTNKLGFKKLCKDFNLPVVEEFSIDRDNIDIFCNNLNCPVLLKPSDNTAGRGICICKNTEELMTGYDYALSFSPSRQVIVEKYVEAKEATIFYTLQNGEILLTSVADRHTKAVSDGKIPLPVAYTFPSEYQQQYIETLNDRVIEMFRSIGLRDGIVFIQSFVENGKFIFYGMGYRLTASLEYHIFSKINDLNTLDLMINYALSGKMSDTDIRNRIDPDFKECGCNITFLAKPGKIAAIEGIEKMYTIPGVIKVVLSYAEGDTIPETATATLLQVVARVFAVAPTKEELINVMDRVHDSFKVYSDKKENMLLPVFNTEELTC